MADERDCTRCGHTNAADANFCSSCGANMSDLVDEPTETLMMPPVSAEAPPDLVGFLVSRGPKAGSRYVLSPGRTTLGRHPDSTIFFDDITVSRRHAEVDFDGRNATVRDVGSLNGTYLNQQPLEGDAEIEEGDVLQIGKFKLVFFAGAPE